MVLEFHIVNRRSLYRAPLPVHSFKSRVTKASDLARDDFRPSEAEVAEFDAWVRDEFKDVLQDKNAPLKLPPKREVEHEIPLRNENAPRMAPRVYKIPHKLIPAWHKLCDMHIEAGIWEPTVSVNAAPMMPQVKKDRVTLRPVVDTRARNENTIPLDIAPVDADLTVDAIAGAVFSTECDIRRAFEQIHVKDKDIPKTAFSTIGGIYVSKVAQQGDHNSPNSLARLMNMVIHGQVG
jgi:hypothetical protein